MTHVIGILFVGDSLFLQLRPSGFYSAECPMNLYLIVVSLVTD